MQGKIEVLGVALPGEIPGIAHASIDRPAAGETGAEWVLDVRGSVVGAGTPVTHVELGTAAGPIHRAPSVA